MATGYMGSGDMGKGLYAAPTGLADDLMDEPLEIEIENPDSVNIGLGGLEIELKPQKETAEDFDANFSSGMPYILGLLERQYKKDMSVKEGIEKGRFDDGPRMEQLDVNFANRYLEAYDQWKNKIRA